MGFKSTYMFIHLHLLYPEPATVERTLQREAFEYARQESGAGEESLGIRNSIKEKRSRCYMEEYKLNIRMSKEELENIAKTHPKVVLVKHTAGSVNTANPWVNLEPWQQSTVDWKNTYASYASNSEVQNGAVINKLSDKMVISGVQLQYNFSTGTFETPTEVAGAANSNTDSTEE